jgi:rSAM/selenodomain-associated transferase 1
VLAFLKEPIPGRVKTRLAADIGPENAARAYEGMVCRVLQQIPENFGICIAYSPAGAEARLRDWLREDLRDRDQVAWIEQVEGDLGERLEAATQALFEAEASPVLVIGTDCPSIDAACYASALKALEAKDAVFGPTLDGGYYLVGTKAFSPALFREIEWSSPRTLEMSLEAGQKNGLKIAKLDLKEDIDDLLSWERAQQDLGL